MRSTMLWSIAGAGALIAAVAGTVPASGGAARVNRAEAEAAVQPAGPPEDCVHIQTIRETRVRDDSTIDFYLNNGKVLRNRLPHSCPSLGFERAFSYSTSQTQLCSVDIITVLHQGGGPRRGASCGLGKFQPVTGAPK